MITKKQTVLVVQTTCGNVTFFNVLHLFMLLFHTRCQNILSCDSICLGSCDGMCSDGRIFGEMVCVRHG